LRHSVERFLSFFHHLDSAVQSVFGKVSFLSSLYYFKYTKSSHQSVCNIPTHCSCVQNQHIAGSSSI